MAGDKLLSISVLHLKSTVKTKHWDETLNLFKRKFLCSGGENTAVSAARRGQTAERQRENGGGD